MANATERMVFLVTPQQKSQVTKRAKAEGLRVGDYVRRQVLDGDDVLGALMQELKASTASARAQIDSTLIRIEHFDKERAAIERQAHEDALKAFRAELDPDRFAGLLAVETTS